MTATTIWRKARVLSEKGISDSTNQRQINAGLFPRPIALGRRAVGWVAHEVAAVNAAVIRGASEDEIKELVRQLEARRKTMSADTDDTIAQERVR